MATTMAGTFDKSLREAIMLREEFATSVADAINVADTPADLKKLMTLTVRFTKSCNELQRDITKRLAEVGPAGSVSSQSPVVPDTSHSSVEASQQAALIGTTEVAIPEALPTVVAVADEMAAQPQPKKGLESTQPETKKGKLTERPKLPLADEKSADLTKIRVVPGPPSVDSLRNIPCRRIFFPYLNPSTTENSLRAGLMALGFEVVAVQLFTWSNKKSRGTAMVTLVGAQETLDIVTKHSIQIDGWTVGPGMMLADVPEISAAEAVAKVSISAEEPAW